MSDTNHDSCWGTIVGNTTDIDCSVVLSACDTWDGGNQSLETAFQSMQANPFSAMTDFNPSIGKSYIEELKKSMEELLFESRKMAAATRSYAEQTKSDDDSDPWIPGGTTDGGGRSGGGVSSGNNDNTPQAPNTPTQTSEAEKVVDSIDKTSLENLKLKELDSVAGSLRDMSKNVGKGIDEVLADDKYNDDIKNLLLTSQYIPDDLKKILTDNDSVVSRLLLEKIMNGEYPEIFDINPLNMGVIYTYLNDAASKNNISVNELLTDEKNAELLKDTLSQFEDVKDILIGWDDLNAEEYQSKLLDVYDGNEVGDKKASSIEILRTFTGYISDESGVAAEELLTETKYADTMKQATQEFGKSSLFASTLTKYSNKGMNDVITSLYNGTNAKALGMDASKISGFKQEVESFVKNNGISIDSLLTDSSYADKAKECLSSFTNTSSIGSIFKNVDANISQNVMKNIYNTKTA